MKELEEKDAQLEAEIQEKIESSNEDKEVTKQRIELQAQLTEAEKELADLHKELDRYKDCDPEEFEKMKNEIEIAREAVERWTDNIFTLRTWCKNKFNMEYSEIDKQLGFPPDFDYFELEEDKWEAHSKVMFSFLFKIVKFHIVNNPSFWFLFQIKNIPITLKSDGRS